MVNETKTTAVILAGGQGRRLGYQDKGMLEWQGKPLIDWVISILATQVDQIIISHNHSRPHYQQLSYETCVDLTDDFQGPLAGLRAAQSQIKHENIIVCPCDMPLLPADLVEQLSINLDDDLTDLTYPLCHERHYYLPVLLRRRALEGLEAYFEQGGRSVKGWFEELTVKTVHFRDRQAFRNFNSESDFFSINCTT